jgi:hypothetical protein
MKIVIYFSGMSEEIERQFLYIFIFICRDRDVCYDHGAYTTHSSKILTILGYHFFFFFSLFVSLS